MNIMDLAVAKAKVLGVDLHNKEPCRCVGTRRWMMHTKDYNLYSRDQIFMFVFRCHYCGVVEDTIRVSLPTDYTT